MSRITRTVAVVVAFFIATLGGLALVGSASAAPGDKYFVCKYVGTPGVDETLQTGQNPISVSENAIKVQPVVVGAFFADDQGQSYVLAKDTGQAEPSVSQCPPPRGAPVTVIPPSATAPTCDMAGRLVITPALHITFSGATNGAGPGTYTIVATADRGYTVVGGTTANGVSTRTYTVTVLPKLSVAACTKPPVVNPPVGLPKSGPPHTGGIGDVNPLNGLIALGLLAAGVGAAAMRFRRATGANQS